MIHFENVHFVSYILEQLNSVKKKETSCHGDHENGMYVWDIFFVEQMQIESVYLS
jgi:hypothetical protein